MKAEEALVVLTERRNWLEARIAAKRQVGWETQWDERERAALSWAVIELGHAALLQVRLRDGAPA